MNPETAAPFSSGGFSALWPQPPWQTNAVSAYLASPAAATLDHRLFNGKMRGYPDVSA